MENGAKTVHIIANPVAGGGKGARAARELLAGLEQRGAEVALHETTRAGDARRFAQTVQGDVIVVIGGDGTLNEVLNGLPERYPLPVAIFPVGTANVVARQLRMPHHVPAAVDTILSGCTAMMDVGLHGGQRFLLGAGAGLDAAVAHAVHASRGKKSSLRKWVGPAIRTVLRYQYPKIRVTVDGEVCAEDGDYVIIGNCRNSAGIFPATPRAVIDDHQLDVCVIRGLTWYRVLWLLARVWHPSFINAPWISYCQGRRISLEPACAGESVPLQVDGDPAGELPAEFEVLDWPVCMVCPEPAGTAENSPDRHG